MQPKQDQDFSTPRKQSGIGVIVMFADTLQKILRATAIPIFVFIIKNKTVSTFYLIIICLIIVVVIAVIAYFRYQRFTFYLDEQEQKFVINEGIFTKTNVTIQLDKIQQVNINQSLLQRLINVYSLHIDTAGSDKTEAKIRAISKDTADCLKRKLVQRDTIRSVSDQRDEARIPVDTTARPFIKLSALTLLKVGITSNYGQTILLIIGFLAAGFQAVRDIKDIITVDEDQVKEAIKQGSSLLSLGIFLFVFLMFLLMINVIRTFLKFYDFEIVKQQMSLAINSGFFAKRNTMLRPHKVQISAYSQNYFQRKLNILDMKMKQNTGIVMEDGQQTRKTDIEVPGCSEEEKNKILALIYHETPVKGEAYFPNYRYVFMGVLVWILFPLAAFFGIQTYKYADIGSYYPLLLFYILAVAAMLYFGYRNHRLYVSEGFIIKTSGIWDIEHEIIEPHKIQSISIKQMLWHKGANVGHITCHTAAGDLTFRFGDYQQIKQLMNLWLYQVESSNKEWM